jgi:predicted AlkP superfamily phosphohydrolase/phosphomutase
MWFGKPIKEAWMIAILQFDAVNLPHLHQFLEQGRLPTFAQLRGRGHWYALETPAVPWEGATYFTLYSGKEVAEHGLYYPFMWSAPDQRVRAQDDFPAPEPIWDRVGNSGQRSLIIDPYEGRRPRTINGKALCGWQFRHKVTLHRWSVPAGLDRQLRRQFGRPSLVEEVYGRPAAKDLLHMRHRLLESPKRAAEAAATLLSQESFDLVWITLSASHLAGHWFLDPARLPQDHFDTRTKKGLDTALGDAYAAVDEAMSFILSALPPEADIIVLSPTGMKPNASRSHLLPGMLQALLAGSSTEKNHTTPGGSLWYLRAAVPRGLRAWVARVLPDRLTLELTARLETRGVDWTKTRAFMVPSGDCGYVRLNLRGRERDGIVSSDEADALLDAIAVGLRTFRDPDGRPAVETIEFASTNLGWEDLSHPFPDLIVHWSERLPPHLAGVSSPQFGEVSSPGWGSGRTGEHSDSAWALILPGSSKLKAPKKSPHIMDIAATVCAVLDVDPDGLSGQPLLEPATTAS